MPSTTSSNAPSFYRRGDIVLVPCPFTDLSAVKQRPALVISPDTANAGSPDVIVAAITSQIPVRLAAGELAIFPADLAACGLPKPSIIRTSKVFTIHQGLIRKKIGTMPTRALTQVLASLRAQFA